MCQINNAKLHGKEIDLFPEESYIILKKKKKKLSSKYRIHSTTKFLRLPSATSFFLKKLQIKKKKEPCTSYDSEDQISALIICTNHWRITFFYQ